MLRLLKDIYSKNNIKGSLDIATNNVLSGWAISPSKKHEPLEVDIFNENNELITSVLANNHRDDLNELFGVDCAFHIELSNPITATKIILKDKKGNIIDSKQISIEPQISESSNSSAGLIGFIDEVDANKISGWAYAYIGNEESLNLIIDNDRAEVIATGKADLFRSDLISYNSGKCGFIFRTLRPINNNERLYLRDVRGNLISEKLAEFNLQDSVIDQSSNILGQMELVDFGVINGWAFNKNSQEESSIKVIDENGGIYGEGLTTIFRDNIPNVPPGKRGFVIYLNGKIGENISRLLLEIDGEVVDKYELDNFNNPVEKLLVTGEYALAWELVSAENSKIYNKNNSLAYILSSAIKQDAWVKIEQIVENSNGSSQLELLYKQLSSLTMGISEVPKLIHTNLIVDRELDVIIKFSLKNEIPSSVEYTWLDKEIFRILDVFLFNRKYLDENTFESLDRIYFYGKLSEYKDLYFEIQVLVQGIPLLPSEFIELEELLAKLDQAFTKTNEELHHSLKFHCIMYLSTLSSNSYGRNLLMKNADLLTSHFENYDYSIFGQRLNGLLLDIYYENDATNKVVEILEHALKLDISSLIWSSRRLDLAISKNYDYLPPRVQKFAIDLLEVKLDQGRLAKEAALLLAKIELGQILSGKMRPFKIKKVIDALLVYKEEELVRECINRLYTLVIARGGSIEGHSDWIRFQNLKDSGLYEPLGLKNSIIFSPIMRDYMGVLIDNNLELEESINTKNKNSLKSLSIHFKETNVPTAYKNYLINEANKMGINIEIGDAISDHHLTVEKGYVLSPNVFQFLEEGTSNYNIVYTDTDGKIAAKFQHKSDASANSRTYIIDDYIYTKGKDKERYLIDINGILKTDNQDSAFNYFSEVLSKFSEAKLLNIGKDSLYALSVDFEKIKSSELTCFIVQRNERARLEKWFDYYRKAGVNRFVVIDNYSDDDTLDFVLKQKDTDVFSTPQPYSSSKYGVDWIDLLIRLYRNNKWCLVADADEELRLTTLDNDLKKVINYMDKNNYDALYAPFIDVYPHGSFKDHPVEMRAYSDQEYYCDNRWYSIFSSHGGYHSLLPTFQGGVRHRKFGLSSVVLNKVPLFKFNRTMVLREGVHWLSNCNPYFGDAQLLHHKYNCLFHDYVIRESKRGEHWNGAVEYKKYNEELSSNSALSLYDPLFSTLVN